MSIAYTPLKQRQEIAKETFYNALKSKDYSMMLFMLSQHPLLISEKYLFPLNEINNQKIQNYFETMNLVKNNHAPVSTAYFLLKNSSKDLLLNIIQDSGNDDERLHNVIITSPLQSRLNKETGEQEFYFLKKHDGRALNKYKNPFENAIKLDLPKNEMLVEQANNLPRLVKPLERNELVEQLRPFYQDAVVTSFVEELARDKHIDLVTREPSILMTKKTLSDHVLKFKENTALSMDDDYWSKLEAQRAQATDMGVAPDASIQGYSATKSIRTGTGR